MINDYWAIISNWLNALTDNEKDFLFMLIPIVLSAIGAFLLGIRWLIKTLYKHRQQKKKDEVIDFERKNLETLKKQKQGLMNDPAKFERYQAEALIHQFCPISGLLGIVCYTDALKNNIQQLLNARNLGLSVYTRTGWYF